MNFLCSCATKDSSPVSSIPSANTPVARRKFSKGVSQHAKGTEVCGTCETEVLSESVVKKNRAPSPRSRSLNRKALISDASHSSAATPGTATVATQTYKGRKASASRKTKVDMATSTEALDLAQNSNVQDAFVIAVEQQARERLERLSALKRIKPVDMTKLSQQLNQTPATENSELNGFIESSPIYVTSVPELGNSHSGKQAVQQDQQQDTIGSAVERVAEGAANARTGSKLELANGQSTEELDSRAEEIELKQDLSSDSVHQQVRPTPTRRTTSPFQNGRTEVLIGQDGEQTKVRTTAIVETKKGECEDKLRRRSFGEAVQQEDLVASQPSADSGEGYASMMSMVELENGPHREMAVDVPESFVGRTKTPPRYPPPKSAARGGYTPTAKKGAPANGSVSKPVPPPRDHLKIEKDGRLVNRAQPPQVPTRKTSAVTPPRSVDEATPTKEQLDRIRKYQEDLRKRKEQEDRLAQEEEFLRSSLRGSRKLQALESHPPRELPTGVVNYGYMLEDAEHDESSLPENLHKVVSFSDLLKALQRLQVQLKKNGHNFDNEIATVQTVLLSPQFNHALGIHNKVQEVWGVQPLSNPVCGDAQLLVRDCLQSLHACSLPDAAELADLLTRYEVDGLLHAHDAIASREVAPMETYDDVNRDNHVEGNIKIVEIEKTNEPLGATVRNDGQSVIIGRIVKGGAAERSGLLHEGDEVLEVNGIEMRGKSVNDVCDILSGMTGTLTFLIVPCSEQMKQPPQTRDTVMHVKAHFDYDPEDDLYIPCRELGISFQKGDVLHVISQDDANWWQAYREGEDEQTLAGLIPSKSFQHQRESMKQSIVGDKTAKEKTKKGGTLLCAKKNPKKKKKKVPYNASYSDEYDADEILTYEEVSLYYPRANHKRPIVLIGPPNIGRHELRQRLMEDSDRFAAAIPHTSRPRKDGEVDGQDYHFISRAQFEADILSRKFVEHGEYEKAYYGTSLDAIRTVVNSGKICVLNLHPQSLKILRNSDLKPYVVFVAPPSLEKLRQKKLRNAETFKEEELKDIIEKAREMEDKYGHYFDMIIINNDTERAYQQLLNDINILEREPQWVPVAWIK